MYRTLSCLDVHGRQYPADLRAYHHAVNLASRYPVLLHNARNFRSRRATRGFPAWRDVATVVSNWAASRALVLPVNCALPPFDLVSSLLFSGQTVFHFTATQLPA
jgi:hypothetical protein